MISKLLLKHFCLSWSAGVVRWLPPTSKLPRPAGKPSCPTCLAPQKISLDPVLSSSPFYFFSILGAPPGQPDELLNSVDHQASVQQLSSEYFSLANPSDVEALYETPSGEKGLTDHSSSEHESNEHAASEHVSGEHTSEEHSSEHSTSEHITGEHITGEHTSGEHTSVEHTSSDHTSSEPADQSSEQTSEVASADQVSGEKAEESGEQTSEVTSSDKNEQIISTPFPSTSAGKPQWKGISL